MIKMADISPAASKQTARAAEEMRAVVKRDIAVKWDRLSESDLELVTDAESLVKQVTRRYSIDDEQAQRNVRAFLNGRRF